MTCSTCRHGEAIPHEPTRRICTALVAADRSDGSVEIGPPSGVTIGWHKGMRPLVVVPVGHGCNQYEPRTT